jgi:hypothetical protein
MRLKVKACARLRLDRKRSKGDNVGTRRLLTSPAPAVLRICHCTPSKIQMETALAPTKSGKSEDADLFGDLINLGHLLCGQIPGDRFHVLLDLLDARRAGDDA